jgi:hypothetical protein
MARPGTAYRALLPHDHPPDYALLATGRLVPAGAGPLASKRLRAAPTAPGYLPRWRYGARRRRDGGR